MAATAELIIKLRGSNRQLLQTLNESESRVKGFGLGLARAGKMAGAAIGVAAVAGTAKAVTSFAGFEKQMNEVFTLLPGISADAMGKMRDDTLDLAKKMGVLPSEVVPAMYQALSAGVPQDNVFAFLESATKVSIGGVTDMATAVDGLTTITNAWGLSSDEAMAAGDALFAGMKVGKTTVGELAANIGLAAPIAAELGVSFQTVIAEAATLTTAGRTTSEAMTQIRAAMVSMLKPNKDMEKAIAAMGYESGRAMIQQLGLQGAIEALKEHADTTGQEVVKLTGRVEGAAAVMTLAGVKSEDARANLEALGASSGAATEAFETMDTGISRTWDRIKANTSAAIIGIGDKISPFIDQALVWFSENLPDYLSKAQEAFQGLVDFLGPWVKKIVAFVKDTLIPLWRDTFAPAIGEVVDSVVGFFRDSLIPFWNDVLWPAINTIVTNIIELWRDTLAPAIGAVVDKLVAFFQENLLPFYEDVVLPAVEGLITLLIAAWEKFEEPVKRVFTAIGTVIEGVIETLGGVLDFVRGVFTGDWSLAWDGIKRIFSGVWDALGGIANIALNGLKILIGSIMVVIQKAWNTAWDGIKLFFSNIWEGVKNIAMTALNWIITNVINPFIRRINDAIDFADRILPGRFGNVSEVSTVGGFGGGLRSSPGPTTGFASGVIPRQHGGPVWPGNAYLVGERGPEIFVPSAAGNIRTGGAGLVINVYGSITTDDDLAETVRRKLIAATNRQGGWN